MPAPAHLCRPLPLRHLAGAAGGTLAVAVADTSRQSAFRCTNEAAAAAMLVAGARAAALLDPEGEALAKCLAGLAQPARAIAAE